MPHADALPVMADDTLVVASSDDTAGVVLGLDPATGSERWRFDTGPGRLLRPVTGAGSVYVIGTDHLVALDPDSGETKWTIGEFGELVDLPPEFGSGAGDTWPVAVAATDEEVVAVRGGAIWYALSVDPGTGGCRWAKFDNGEGGFHLQAVAEDVFVQRTNCAPVVYDRDSGEPEAWIDPQASPSDPGTFEDDYCGSYPDIALAATSSGVVVSGLTTVMAVQR